MIVLLSLTGNYFLSRGFLYGTSLTTSPIEVELYFIQITYLI